MIWWAVGFVLPRVRLQAQDLMLTKTQTCVQELTTELRNRCLELKEQSHRIQDGEKLLQVRAGGVGGVVLLKSI